MRIKRFVCMTYILVCWSQVEAIKGDAANTQMEQQFEKCCGLGSSWAAEALKCEKFSGPVSGVPPAEQGLCLETVSICCKREHYKKSCENGQDQARRGHSCSDTTTAKKSGGGQFDDYQRDCCEGCKLGILSGSLGQNCAFKAFAFGKPWDSAFLECCNEATSSTINNNATESIGSTTEILASTPASSSPNSTSSLPPTSSSSASSSTIDDIPTPDTDDICQLLKGLLCSHICVPTVGSYRCDCPKGYVLLEDEKTCRTDGPLNEQALTSSVMSTESTTVTGGATETETLMRCPSGYRYNSSTGACNGPMDYQDGKFREEERQTCPPGYQWDQQLGACEDIDECIDPTLFACPPESHLCVNTEGSFTCHELLTARSCPAGFKFDLLGKICKDVDECAEDLHGCLPEVETCRNTEGAYECDIQCRPGFTFSRNLGLCIDIDECAGIHGNPCPSDKPTCVNGPGGFKCIKEQRHNAHSEDYHSFGKTKVLHERPIVDRQDHQEPVQNDSHLEADHQHDKPQEGVSKIKYHRNKQNQSLHRQQYISHEDQAEAKIERNDDNEFAEVRSNPSSSFSQSKTLSQLLRRPCPPGYRFNGAKCVDIDECSEGPGCREYERCSNRLGGYDCRLLCSSGWYFDRTSKSCQDVDECLLGRHNCTQSHFCENTNGSFMCVELPPCAPGYRRTLDKSCADVDECANGFHNCQSRDHQYCINRPGGFDCITRLPECEDGFKYSLGSRRCEDVDECNAMKNPCDSRLLEKCVNLKGSFRCERPEVVILQRSKPACPPGFQYDIMRRQCEDIDECREKTDLCGQEICYNQPGGYSCAPAPVPITDGRIREKNLPTSGPRECSPGLRYVRNRGCADIDECQEIDDVCSSYEDCVNTVGSYKCNCRGGFRRDNLTQACVDINECQLQNDCLPTQRCDNTLGSYNCVRFLPCGTGYTLNAASEICEDDDECVLGTHDCSDGYHCRNTLGSYRCVKNPRGQHPSPPRTTTRLPVTSVIAQMTTTMMTPALGSRNQPERSCPKGFTLGSRGECNDINECASNPCASHQQCANTIGSFRCTSRVICGAGFILDSKTGNCVDVDECSEGTHRCGPRQTCENRPGGYACACPPGYALGPSRDCVDIDECSIYGGYICGAKGKCENTVGSFKCVCETGFEKMEGSNTCEDINECEKVSGLCQHECVNVWGSYKCVCKMGYTLNPDNRSCSDVDECQLYKDNKLCVGFCENTPGSYSCRCPDGYRLGEDGWTCQDIDECGAGTVCRDPNEMCQNTRGGYRCNKIQCPQGYHRDQERKNRCIRSSRYCSPDDISCYQSPSHFSYNFITFVSMLPIPRTGQLELFTMRGTHLPGSVVRFSMALVDARAPPGVTRATESCFALRRPSASQAVLVLTRSLPGPQEIELDLSMEIYHDTAFAGSAVAKLFIYVTRFSF